jgi:hypothetical protein
MNNYTRRPKNRDGVSVAMPKPTNQPTNQPTNESTAHQTDQHQRCAGTTSQYGRHREIESGNELEQVRRYRVQHLGDSFEDARHGWLTIQNNRQETMDDGWWRSVMSTQRITNTMLQLQCFLCIERVLCTKSPPHQYAHTHKWEALAITNTRCVRGIWQGEGPRAVFD